MYYLNDYNPICFVDINIDTIGGTMRCEECGLIVENGTISDQLETRDFGDDASGGSLSRVGGPQRTTDLILGTSTTIKGNSELARANNRQIDPAQKHLMGINQKLSQLRTQMNLQKVSNLRL